MKSKKDQKTIQFRFFILDFGPSLNCNFKNSRCGVTEQVCGNLMQQKPLELSKRLFLMDGSGFASVTTYTRIHSSFSHWTKTPNVYINIDTHFVDPTALEQLRLPMQMSRLSPTPDRGKVIWTAEYKWLGMIDRPSHWPPSTDR